METYNTDIEMIMDFMKLSLAYDKVSTYQDKKDILKLQQGVIELLPIAQSNRISSIHSIMNEIYNKNKENLSLLDKDIAHDKIDDENFKRDHFIVLFYNNTCSACNKIMPIWEEFKQNNEDSNFTILQWDASDPTTTKVFEYFNITEVPTIIKLELDKNNYVTHMTTDITLEYLNDFGHF